MLRANKNFFMNSVSNIYHPVKWDQHMTSNDPVAFTAPEHKKVSDIKWLHPFKYKVISLLFGLVSLC
jgi:replication factor A1